MSKIIVIGAGIDGYTFKKKTLKKHEVLIVSLK